MSCDVSCQSKGYASCEASLQGGCQAQCSQPKGALFCDGQYVNASNVDQCIADLKALLNIQVSGEASGNCSGNTCSGQASGSVSCGVAPATPPLSGTVLALGLGAAAAGVVRRRRGR
jgi:MYXO-CTERM domain-containing protein